MFLVANAYLLVEEGWIYGSRRDYPLSLQSNCKWLEEKHWQKGNALPRCRWRRWGFFSLGIFKIPQTLTVSSDCTGHLSPACRGKLLLNHHKVCKYVWWRQSSTWKRAEEKKMGFNLKISDWISVFFTSSSCPLKGYAKDLLLLCILFIYYI